MQRQVRSLRREFSSVPRTIPAAVELYIRYMQARRAKPSTVANRHYKLSLIHI